MDGRLGGLAKCSTATAREVAPYITRVFVCLAQDLNICVFDPTGVNATEIEGDRSGDVSDRGFQAERRALSRELFPLGPADDRG